MANMLRHIGRTGSLLRHQNVFLQRSIQPLGATLGTSMSNDSAQSIAYKEMEEFWAKNRKLERPLSPHLSIYSPQLTSMLSLAHRATGIMMAVTVPAVATLLLGLPGDFSSYIQLVKDLQLSPVLLTAFKYVLAFPVVYHYINGIRHLNADSVIGISLTLLLVYLAWDWAMGFSLQRTYQSGYFVLMLSLLVTAGFVHLL